MHPPKPEHTSLVTEYLRPAKNVELEPLEQEISRLAQDLNEMSDCLAGLFVFVIVLFIAIVALIAF